MRSTIWLLTLAFAACSSADASPGTGASGMSSGAAAAVKDTTSHAGPPVAAAAGQDHGPRTELPPNELGRIPILEYHLVGKEASRWTVTPEQLRRDMELLWQHGYRPVTMKEMVAGSFDLPAGTSPVVFTFDDASPGQFGYIEQGGQLKIDPGSAVGIWDDFARTHPGWGKKAVFCVLSGAAAGRSFFGDKGIEGQKSEWRFRKLQYLAEQGYEICNHTLWHASLSEYPDAVVQEQIARLQLAVDSAVPGYRVQTFALPLGQWPKNRALAARGSWTDPKSGRTVTYEHRAVLRVAGEPSPGPHDPAFNPLSLMRVQMFDDALPRMVDQLEKARSRYVSDGNPDVVAKPSSQ